MPGERAKDKILEEQQKEIDNLKRMVEMQRQQLHNHQFKETIQVSCCSVWQIWAVRENDAKTTKSACQIYAIIILNSSVFFFDW